MHKKRQKKRRTFTHFEFDICVLTTPYFGVGFFLFMCYHIKKTGERPMGDVIHAEDRFEPDQIEYVYVLECECGAVESYVLGCGDIVCADCGRTRFTIEDG